MPRIEDRMGISYRQLDHWCKEGYLKPEGGNGTQRVWPQKELRIGRMMSRLIALGVTPSFAAVYARDAVENRASMVLEFYQGRLHVTGRFSKLLKEDLVRLREIRDSRKYRLDKKDKAC
jgi:DNA-binding transcriptional MerR regulator